MPERITPLAIIKAQRDRLAVEFHDLHVEHAMTKAMLADVSRQLSEANARLAEIATAQGDAA